MNGQKIGTNDEEREIRVTATNNPKPATQCSKEAGRVMAVLIRA